jgi:predicted DNA-binding ribbon-helix-helix protein
MKSLVVKRSIIIGGHKTSVSLESAFWQAFKHIAALRNMTLSDLVMSIDAERKGNLSSAIRLFVLEFYRDQIEATAARRTKAARGTTVARRASAA